MWYRGVVESCARQYISIAEPASIAERYQPKQQHLRRTESSICSDHGTLWWWKDCSAKAGTLGRRCMRFVLSKACECALTTSTGKTSLLNVFTRFVSCAAGERDWHDAEDSFPPSTNPLSLRTMFMISLLTISKWNCRYGILPDKKNSTDWDHCHTMIHKRLCCVLVWVYWTERREDAGAGSALQSKEDRAIYHKWWNKRTRCSKETTLLNHKLTLSGR